MHNHNFLSIATAPVLTEKTAQALELNKILKENDINKIEISDTALKIVKKKSMEKNISIKEYVSSLIISRI